MDCKDTKKTRNMGNQRMFFGVKTMQKYSFSNYNLNNVHFFTAVSEKNTIFATSIN